MDQISSGWKEEGTFNALAGAAIAKGAEKNEQGYRSGTNPTGGKSLGRKWLRYG